MLTSRNIGGVNVFRASENCEDWVYQRVKRRVFQTHVSGVYTDIIKVTDIVNTAYCAYYELIDEYLPQVDHREFAQFLGNEYELYGQVAEIFKNGQLSLEDEEYWQSYASHARRGIKHLLELLCMEGMTTGNSVSTIDEEENAVSILFVAVEELVSLYMRSDHYRSLLDEIRLVLDESKHVYFDVAQDRDIIFDIRGDASDADKYIPNPSFLTDSKRHNKILEPSFIQKFGISYSDVLGCLQFLITKACESEYPGMYRRIRVQHAIGILCGAFPINAQQARRIIDGFALTAQNMRTEGRELFRPKQQHRAYKRGFFLVAAENGEELFFSKRMALECLSLLVADVPFRKFPSEWHSHAIDDALNTLSLQAGRWFEQVVQSNFATVGIDGIPSLKRLVFKNGSRLEIPSKVGEIDFLGLCQNRKMIIVAEVKQVGFATEPRMFLDDLDKFITRKDNYSEKFERKFKWVIEHHEVVGRYLAERLSCSAVAEHVGYVMITHYPMFVSRKIIGFSCVSITEFMQRYKENRTWKFSKTDIG